MVRVDVGIDLLARPGMQRVMTRPGIRIVFERRPHQPKHGRIFRTAAGQDRICFDARRGSHQGLYLPNERAVPPVGELDMASTKGRLRLHDAVADRRNDIDRVAERFGILGERIKGLRNDAPEESPPIETALHILRDAGPAIVNFVVDDDHLVPPGATLMQERQAIFSATKATP